MPYRGRVTIEGLVAGGGDIWTTSFHTGSLSGFSLSALNEFAADVSSLWISSCWNDSPGGFLDAVAPETLFTGVTVRDIADTGVTQRVVTAGPGSPVAGTSEFPSLPSECAVVVSLLTATAGARGRGRMYLPPFAADALDTNGILSSATATAVADQMDVFITNVNNNDPDPGAVQVYSQTDDVLRLVTNIRVGNIIDSQRRRRNALAESYLSRAIT